jgi:nucleoside-diphosphate-sugar epimerase
MKVILTGVTGFIGHETLLQCLANTRITSIVALSRRVLPDSIPKDPKLKVLLLEDFTNYTPEIMKELEGAEACVWYVASIESPLYIQALF